VFGSNLIQQGSGDEGMSPATREGGAVDGLELDSIGGGGGGGGEGDRRDEWGEDGKRWAPSRLPPPVGHVRRMRRARILKHGQSWKRHCPSLLIVGRGVSSRPRPC